jgi:hypothetical protein
MTDQLIFRLSDVSKDVDPRQHVVSLLEGVGLSSTAAQRLVDDELEIASVTGLKTLTKLLEGQFNKSGNWIEASEECQTAGAKLLSFLSWDGVSETTPEPFTEKEKAVALVQTLDVSVRSGFGGRLATYAKNPQQSQAVLTMCQPTVITTNFSNDGPDAKRDKTRRMIAAAAEVLGVSGFSEVE